jgi:hypothetical protein
MSDHASRAIIERSLLGESPSYSIISNHSNVPRSTLNHRDRGRPSRTEKGQRQQYLTPLEEDALEKYLKLMADLGTLCE